MKKFITVILGIVGLVVVLVAALAIYIATIDPNDYKDYIAERVRENTGRQASLNGDIKISLYPWLGLEINDVTLANADNFGEDPFLHVDYAQIRIKTVPLLQDQYEIDTIKLYGAVLNLSKNNEGTTNWGDLTGEGPEGRDKEAMHVDSVVIGGVDIRDARLTWRDDSTGALHEIQDLDLSTGELVYGDPIELRMSVTASSNQPEISSASTMVGTVTYNPGSESVSITPLEINSGISSKNIPGGTAELLFSSEVNIDLAAGTASVSNLSISALEASISGDINATNMRTKTPAIEATMDINGSDLALLFKVAEIEPLATQLAGLAQRQFNVNTRMEINLERGDVNLPEFNADLLGANIKGQLRAQNIQSDKPGVQGEVNASGPDLPTLLQVIGQFETGDEPKLEKYGKQLATIPAGQKAFSVEAYIDADLGKGNINVPTLSVRTLGITVAGNLKSTDMQSRNGNINGKLEVTGSGMSRVLAAIEQQSLSEVLQEFRLQTSVSGNRTNLNLKPISLTASLAGEKIPNSPVQLAVNADTRINLESEELKLDAFTVQGLGLNVRGNLDARDILKGPRFQGQLTVDEFNLRQLMDQLNMEIPVTADNTTLRKVALSSDFSGSEQDMEIKKLNLVLDDTTLKGNMSVKNFKQPASEFNFQIDSLDADRYLPPAEDKTAKQNNVSEEPAIIPVDTLRDLNANGSLHIDNFIVSKIKMKNVNLKLNGKDGIVKLNPVSADLYQGKHTGDITVNVRDKLPRLTINTALKNVQVEPLITDVTGKRKIRGTGNFSAALFAVGDNTSMLKQTLNGQMSFNFKDGALIGYNLGKIMRMGNQLKETMTLKVTDHEETDFAEITGNPVAQNGVVTLDDLNAKSPGLRLGGKGILTDLPNNMINYDIEARIVATSKGQGGKDITEGKLEGVPLECNFKGPLDNPKRDCNAVKLMVALGLKLVEGIVKLPTKVIPGGSGEEGGQNPVNSLINAIPGVGNKDETQEQPATQDDAPQQPENLEDSFKKGAGDLLRGILDR